MIFIYYLSLIATVGQLKGRDVVYIHYRRRFKACVAAWRRLCGVAYRGVVRTGGWMAVPAICLFLVTTIYAQTGNGPTNLNVSLVGQDVVELTWDPPAVDGASVNHYDIRYEEQTGALQGWENGTIGALGSATSTQLLLRNRTQARYYTYRMFAVRNGVESEWSNSVTYDADTDAVVALPAAPGGLTASPRDGAIGLSWDDPADATIVNYQLRYAPGGMTSPPNWTGVVWSDIAGSDAGTTDHDVTDLIAGTEYTFEMRARNAAGVGDSSVVTATPGLPSPPVNLSSTPGDGSVRLTWDDPGDVRITGYQRHVQHCHGPGTGLDGHHA